MKKAKWIVNIKGGAGQRDFEISVVRSDNKHGIKSYGWFDENKLLVSHNGGPCQWPLMPIVWQHVVDAAEATAKLLNQHEALGTTVGTSARL